MRTLCGTILAATMALAAFGNDGNCPVAASGQTVRGGDEHPSRGVIARFAGDEVAAAIKIEEIPCAPGGRQVYEIADNGRTVRGSSPTAICRAFYDNAKSKNAAIATWSRRSTTIPPACGLGSFPTSTWGVLTHGGINGTTAFQPRSRTLNASMSKMGQTVSPLVQNSG